MNSNPYAALEPNLTPSLVCVADILGWSERSRLAFERSSALELLRTARKALSDAYRRMREQADDLEGISRFFVKTFTDNVVIGLPVTSGPYRDAEPEFGEMMGLAAAFQVALASQGFLVRGAISFGPHYMDEDFVFWGPLIEASELNRHGLPPRIVLAPSVEKLVRLHVLKYGGDVRGTPHYQTLLEDRDGRLFPNYLDQAFDFFPDAPVIDDLLVGHKKTILDGIELYRGRPEIRTKFEWAASYHNFACETFVNRYRLGDQEDDGERIAQAEAAERVLEHRMDIDLVKTRPGHLSSRWNTAADQ